MKFRPCIDLHEGMVKQIVGSTLSDKDTDKTRTNFIADTPASWFAELYKKDNLKGGHIIQLGKGNESAAQSALKIWPGNMQIGGGVNAENAAGWIDKGAQSVIVTSYVFHDGVIDEQRLKSLSDIVGKKRLVLDLSCRKKNGEYYVVTNRWQTFTDEKVTHKLLDYLSKYCHEYLIHAVDVEGKCSGIETELVKILGTWAGLPVTYAGGISNPDDIEAIKTIGRNAIDFTVGSALDIFGGSNLKYSDLVQKYGN
jgi:phosphoribosylformimino-5-aminoimidazole carboxamide ribotide isomerase